MTFLAAPARRRSRANGRASVGTIVVHKFGGAALATGEGLAAIVARAVEAARRAKVVVVVSAVDDTTDVLLALAHAASEDEITPAIEQLRHRHERLADVVGDPQETAALRRLIDAICRDGAARLRDAPRGGAIASSDLDAILAAGERLAAAIVAAALRCAGARSEVVDATTFLHTDGNHGCGTPDLARTSPAARAALLPLLAERVIPVVPGFIGSGLRDDVVTLGRGGSDLTATVLAAVLEAREVVLWKDVPGLLTADPRVVPAARVIPRVDVREAAELARHGAQVLHPRALVPVGARTRALVRPLAHPESTGTEISRRPVERGAPVRAIAATMDQALVRVTGHGLRPFPAVLTRALAALREAGIDPSLVTQAVSDYDLALVVQGGHAARAVAVLRDALGAELARGEVGTIEARTGVATIGIVGLGLARHPAAMTRATDALAAAGIPVLAAAHAATGTSVSLVVDAGHAAEAQRGIHAALELHKTGGGGAAVTEHADVVLLGAGAIGQELLAQLAAARGGGAARLRVCGVVDRSGYVFDPRGLSRRRLEELRALKRVGRPLATAPGGVPGSAAQALEHIATHALSRPIVVDATAADTTRLLETALAHGFDLVLANKVPLAADQAACDRFLEAARHHGRRIRHEATVGAGLPVIDTLRKLLDAGDRVLRIEGCPSGTLGFLFGEVNRGRPFSAALRDAIEARYTEPDPRTDLTGIDVARKALILARLIGFRGDLADIAVESLVPEPLRVVSRDEFLARVAELDAPWAARVSAARVKGRVLRYRVRITRRTVAVGIVSIPAGDPLAMLDGTDNQFAFTTARYRQRPLVITGPGAGEAVAAAGVYNDLLQLAAERTASPPPARGMTATVLSS